MEESHLHISLAAEKIGSFLGFPITNTLIMSLFSVLLLAVVAFLVSRRMQVVPTGLQNLVESIVEGALNLMDSVTQDRRQSLRFFPLVFTFFVFILVSNWLGLLPGVGTITVDTVDHGKHIAAPIFRSTNADLNVTVALAMISVLAIQAFGIVSLTAKTYSKKFFNFKNPIFTFVGLIELISEISRLISFSFRLFGNVFAGEVLLVVIAFLVPFIIPLPFLFIEVFVGFIQAFIFAILTLVFLKVATTAEEH